MHPGQEELEAKAKFPHLGGFFHTPRSNMHPSHEEEIHLGNDHNSSLSAEAYQGAHLPSFLLPCLYPSCPG